jgi:hypothetical protein
LYGSMLTRERVLIKRSVVMVTSSRKPMA